MTEYWVVAKTKPQKERWAAENVARQGFQYYLPLTTPEKTKKATKPQFLFPRYLFVLTEGRWRSLLGTFGIAGLVMTGETPAIMPAREIDRLKAREDGAGLIQLPQVVARFEKGDAVRINSGTFSGFTGIYDHASAGERVLVLLEYLGRKTRVLIGEEYLELANG